MPINVRICINNRERITGMDRQEIKAGLAEICQNYEGYGNKPINLNEIDEGIRVKSLAKSLIRATIITAAAKKFNIEIDDDDWYTLDAESVGYLIDFIDTKINQPDMSPQDRDMDINEERLPLTPQGLGIFARGEYYRS